MPISFGVWWFFFVFGHSPLGAVMSALSDLVPSLIDLDVGALRLQFLYAFEAAFMDDWGGDG